MSASFGPEEAKAFMANFVKLVSSKTKLENQMLTTVAAGRGTTTNSHSNPRRRCSRKVGDGNQSEMAL
jgi:hypothetical protein